MKTNLERLVEEDPEWVAGMLAGARCCDHCTMDPEACGVDPCHTEEDCYLGNLEWLKISILKERVLEAL